MLTSWICYSYAVCHKYSWFKHILFYAVVPNVCLMSYEHTSLGIFPWEKNNLYHRQKEFGNICKINTKRILECTWWLLYDIIVILFYLHKVWIQLTLSFFLLQCYFNILTGSRFYSKEEVLRYLDAHELSGPTSNKEGGANANAMDFHLSSKKGNTHVECPHNVSYLSRFLSYLN